MTDVFCVTGAGGVGKTTLSAGVAVRLARTGQRTLVITVDPARRLGQALGLTDIAHDPRATTEPNLWASMLDARGSWEDIARRYAPADSAERLLGNAFFQAVARRFPASQSYAAADTMTREVQDGRWDAVVVDTPPSAGGVEFFTAPRDLLALINGPLLRALTGAGIPGSRTAFRFTVAPFLRIADGILGSAVLEDLTEFLFDLRTTVDGLTARSQAIERVYRSTRNLIVTTADPMPLGEALNFANLLPGLTSPPDSILFNRAVPPQWEHETIPPGDSPEVVNFRLWATEAARQRWLRQDLRDRLRTPVHTVAWASPGPAGTDDLARLIPNGLLESGPDGGHPGDV